MSYFLFLFYTKLLDLFYTKMLDLNLAIVNCFCFLSQKLWLHNTFCISARKNTKKIEIRPILPVFRAEQVRFN